MIKAKFNDGSLLFGLSDENIERLQNGEPIKFNLKDMGLEDRVIIILHGNTEEQLYESMTPFMDLKKTKINI